MILKNKGILFVLSSPSGAGKTTISEKLLMHATSLVRSISVTTRQPRPGEIHGKDYFFVTEEKFHKLCQENKMLEYAKVFRHFYGIPKDFIEQNINNQISVLLTIDWQGAFHLFNTVKEQVVSIFIMPPSMGELKLRLKKRNSDHASEIDFRLKAAYKEINTRHKYDYIVVNDDIDHCVQEIIMILNTVRRNICET
ncbi:guanylate kinase [Wolbachia endosymbiont of Howardula sp.]|uniref:guanylate kinase n=1 Tax=Wolbachia endosymbiont of Howardula sp. TaxID=2916816 RepID=UPI00217EE642|nr:guanylate kinase [Wolbachia endosymbiont of Howardula sp.]UWI83406.1 guanylate kinase [Wolbachia endosymbiont of Howardula sp.]